MQTRLITVLREVPGQTALAVSPNARVAVYQPGGTFSTLAPGVVDGDGTPVNPLTADSNGQVRIGVPDGIYDLRITHTDGVTKDLFNQSWADQLAAAAEAKAARDVVVPLVSVATAARDQSLAAKEATLNAAATANIYPTASAGVDTAVKSGVVTAPGSGGTNGTFNLVMPAPDTGGTLAVVQFTVSGGSLSSFTIVSPGTNYFRDSATIEVTAAMLSASAGLIGAAGTLRLGGGVPFGRGFVVPSSAMDGSADLYLNVAGVAVLQVGKGLPSQPSLEPRLIQKIDIPGYSLALISQGWDLPLLIPDDFSKFLFLGVDIAHQIAVQVYDNGDAGNYNIIMDDVGRCVVLGGTTGSGAGTADQFALDTDRYTSDRYAPIRVEPAVLSNGVAGVPVADAGALNNRIPGFAVSPSGFCLLVWEGRTGGDFDPKNINFRAGQLSLVNGQWKVVWGNNASTILAHDFGVQGDGSTGENTLGNPTPVWDSVTSTFKLIMYWRRGDVASGDASTTPAGGAETTTRLYGLEYNPATGSWTNWDGTAFALGGNRTGMTDLTSAKPATWGSGSPGPGHGLCRRNGEVWFQAHGWDAGDGSINPRSVALMRLNRASKRLELVAQSPTLYKPNESGLAEDLTSGYLVLDSRSLGNDFRVVNRFNPATSTWVDTELDVTRADPQAAGDIQTVCDAGSKPFPRPQRTVSANNASRYGSGSSFGGASERRGLTIYIGYQGGKAGSWKAKRRIYDQITVEQQDSAIAGNVVSVTTDAYGGALGTPANLKLFTGYPVLAVGRGDLLLMAFETNFIAPGGASSAGIGLAYVPLVQTFQNT